MVVRPACGVFRCWVISGERCILSGLFEGPLDAVLGVLDVEAEGGELVADQVGGRPVFVALGVGADLHQQVDGAFVGLEVGAGLCRCGAFGRRRS